MSHNEVARLRARVEILEAAVAEAYQLAGAIGAPVRVLDYFDAAVSGTPLPQETFLPIRAEECEEVASLLRLLQADRAAAEPQSEPASERVSRTRRNTLAAVLGRTGGQKRSRAKAAAVRANGAKGGRPRKQTQASSDANARAAGRTVTERRTKLMKPLAK